MKDSRILLGHGGGGRLMHDLLDRVVRPAFANPALDARHDGAVLGRLAFTTDGYVVRPLFFPGGDIGSLSVHGTVNDLAMCGARPLGLGAAFILEEGFPVADLQRVVASMRRAADEAGVAVVTGDTKVVERGKGDGLYVTTTGVGELVAEAAPSPGRVEPGDAILLSGDVGRHGIAILSAREGLAFESAVVSDSSLVHAPALALRSARCLRDLTRGGLGTALLEIAEARGVAMEVVEEAVPVEPGVRAACELLGLDPIYVACEGRFIAFVPEPEAERALSLMRSHPVSAGARRIGRVGEPGPARVTLRTPLGSARLLDMFSGEQLPRIC